MDGKQLYAGGEPFFPESAAEKIKALDIYGLTETEESNVQLLINVIAQMVANTLLAKTDIAAWAKEENKPVYTAEEVGADTRGSAGSALEEAKSYADSTYIQATGYTDQQIAGLINGAPSTLGTIGEIAAAMLEHEEVVEALEAAIGNKASEVEYQAHAGNSAVHVTASKQAKWDGYGARLDEISRNLNYSRFRMDDGVKNISVAEGTESVLPIKTVIVNADAENYEIGTDGIFINKQGIYIVFGKIHGSFRAGVSGIFKLKAPGIYFSEHLCNGADVSVQFQKTVSGVLCIDRRTLIKLTVSSETGQIDIYPSSVSPYTELVIVKIK